ncbi:FtsW/RodA/SpoVE family cell cycle protein [Brevibacillus borstelensis]|uniref:FtsW/RodA/SpoVE family cell cycle protein n=1 Tax=Brevibacillus borstelensis TaxID=45462 RepID=UPI002E2042C4|nr:FtsW/RodA/SpoVE family cell cycle protein [Brevibacillus borstelensis]MED1747183.1 FtsW/RodA/SpoVE family cell cycle protein [Brevibacillus borstelensis]
MTPNDKIQAYIRQVCSQIRCKDVHPAVTLELESHIADKVEDLMESGSTEAEAVERALAEMGDPFAVGKHLHEAHKPRMEWSVVGMVAALIGIGLLVLLSLIAGNPEDIKFLKRQLVFICFGIAAFVALLYANYSKMKAYGLLMYMGTLLAVFFAFTQGKTMSGKPYLDIGIPIDIVRLSPFLLIISLAGIFSDWNWQRKLSLWLVLGLYFVPLLFYVKAPDLFAGILFSVGFFVPLFRSPASRRQACISLGTLLIGAVALLLLTMERYQLDRLLYWVNPYEEPMGRGYMLIRSLEAIRSAGLWGHGFGTKLEGLGYTAALGSDFIFVYLVYAFGLAAGVGVLLIGMLLLMRLFRAAKQTNDRYGALLMCGLAAMFFTEYFWGILMAIGWVPFFSAPIPLISYGGLTFISHMAILGLVLGIYRQKDVRQPLSS